MIRHWLVGLKMTSKAYRRALRRRQAWTPEGLEDRLLLSGNPTAYIVNLTSDTGAGSGNSGDLRYVITQANANTNTGGSVITFDPTVFASQQEINLDQSPGIVGKRRSGSDRRPRLLQRCHQWEPVRPGFHCRFWQQRHPLRPGHRQWLDKGPGGGINNDGTLAVVNCSIYGNYMPMTAAASITHAR